MPVKREKNSNKSRLDILQAAEDHFARKGFYGARIDEIAAQAGINKRMIYEYYGNKEDLYRKVLQSVYNRMSEEEQRLQAAGLSGKELVCAIISLYFRFLHQDPNFVNILMWENLNRAEHLRQLPAHDLQRPTILYFREAIREGVLSGVFRAGIDEKQVVITLVTICFANFSNCHTLSYIFDCKLCSEEVIESRKQQTIDLVLSYLCT